LSTIGELTVTEQIIKEAIRLYPPVHIIPRVTTRDVTINGYRIPKGTEPRLSYSRT